MQTASHGQPSVIITGASEGVGRAFAHCLSQKRLHVVLVARDGESLEAFAKELGQRAYACALDLTSPDAADLLENFLATRGLFADVLINNAGVGAGGRFDDLSKAAVEQTLAVNILATVRLTHHFIGDMRRRGRGGVLNLASLGGFMPGPWQALYFASKAFVLSFSQSIAAECAADGVHVMAAAPGPVETRIHRAMKTRWSFYRRFFPSYEPEAVVPLLWDGFTSGHRVLIPGLISNLSALASAFIPNEFLVPIVGYLIRPRFRNGRPVS